MVLSVLPPMEGWDEYQHVAYIAHWVERGRAPVLHLDSTVPRSLYPHLARYPHPELALEQLGGLGARSYEEYWRLDAPTAPPPDAGPILLYQAQHPPLYYRLVAPVYRWIGVERYLELVTALRVVNVLLGAAAIAACFAALSRLTADGLPRRLIALLICLQPLLLMSCARVANDGLALLLGTILVALLFCGAGRRPVLTAALAGPALGLALLAKAVNLALVPLVPLVYGWHALRRRLRPSAAAAGALITLGIAAGIGFEYFRFNLAHFGLLTPMQEAVENARRGRVLGDAWSAASAIDWGHELSRRLLRHSLWTGGWSYLRPPTALTEAHQYTLIVGALAGLLALRTSIRRSRAIFLQPGIPLFAAACGAACAAGMGYHMVHSQMVGRGVGTNAWYAAASFPWLLCLYVQGLAYLPGRWIGFLPAINLTIIYFATEVFGVFGRMAPCYAGLPWSAAARARLDGLHPGWLDTAWTVPAAVAAGLLLIAAYSALGGAPSKAARDRCETADATAEPPIPAAARSARS